MPASMVITFCTGILTTVAVPACGALCAGGAAGGSAPEAGHANGCINMMASAAADSRCFIRSGSPCSLKGLGTAELWCRRWDVRRRAVPRTHRRPR